MSLTCIFLILLSIFTLLFIVSMVKQHARCKKNTYSKRIKRGLKILDKLYQNVNGMEISLLDRQKLKNDDPSFTYGEVTFPSIAVSLAIAEPKPGEVFYDLGAGAGKGVFCSALLNDWKKCCGIELLPALYECTQTLLTQLKQMPEAREYFAESLQNIQFIQSDIATADFSDADIVYMNATTFSPELWDTLLPKLNALKSGTRIIVLTKRLDKDHFELIQETSLPMSWGMNSVMIYKKK